MQTPTLVTHPAFRVIGMAWTSPADGTLPELWQRFIPRIAEAKPLSDASYGICQAQADGQFRYIAAVAVAADTAVPDGMVALDIPEQDYAIVEHRGPVRGLPDTFRTAYTEWLPEAGLAAVAGIEFEYMDSRFLGPEHADSVVELYIPVSADDDGDAA